jgi:hypothetical protein
MKRTYGQMLAVLSAAMLCVTSSAKAQSASDVLSQQSIQMIQDVRSQFDRFMDYVRADSAARVAAADEKSPVIAVRNPFRALIEQSEALGLTDTQLDSIAFLNRNFLVATETELRSLRQSIDNKPLTRREIRDSVLVVMGRVLDRESDMTDAARSLLTPAQLQLVPADIAKLIDPDRSK